MSTETLVHDLLQVIEDLHKERIDLLHEIAKIRTRLEQMQVPERELACPI